MFEMKVEEGLDLVEEFYADELVKSQQLQSGLEGNAGPKFHQREGFAQDIQKGLEGSVRVVN